ncbi:MAG: VanZ family protein [Deltaproteobacteria bacterium]|nr:VanZ family protein [Deltaproteobacteria bacterium]
MAVQKNNPNINSSSAITEEAVLRYRNVYRSIAYIIILVIIVLSVIPDPDTITPFSASDKFLHTLAYAVSMLWFGLCFKRERLLAIGAGLVILGVALEVIQGRTGYRTMSLGDIIANFTGVIIGLVISFSRFSKVLQYVEQRLLK